MKKLFIIIFVLSFFRMNSVKAQHAYDKNLFAISWEVGFPGGKTKDFLDKTSWAGGRIEYRHFIHDNFSVGGFMDWNSYYKYFPTATYTNQEQTQAVTTDMYRYIYTLPFGLNAHYYFEGSKHLRPYVGLGLGTQYSQQSLYYNIFVTEGKNWGFLVRPEAGVLIKFEETSRTHILFGASYSYSTNKNSSFKINNMQFFLLNLGVAWTF